ncbi:CORIN enzyme, partial [Polypterus senegalus]
MGQAAGKTLSAAAFLYTHSRLETSRSLAPVWHSSQSRRTWFPTTARSLTLGIPTTKSPDFRCLSMASLRPVTFPGRSRYLIAQRERHQHKRLGVGLTPSFHAAVHERSFARTSARSSRLSLSFTDLLPLLLPDDKVATVISAAVSQLQERGSKFKPVGLFTETLCKNSKERCESVLGIVGLQWPEHIDCTQFPEENVDNTSCLMPDQDVEGCLEQGLWECPSNNVCIKHTMICDGFPDCPDLADEKNCLTLSKTTPSLLTVHKFATEFHVCADEWQDDLSALACQQMGLRQPCHSRSKVSIVCEKEECGFRPAARMTKRILGGRTSRPGRWPWQCSMQSEPSGHICGCVLIGKKWVLTVAHCFEGREKASVWRVVFGINNLDHPSDFMQTRQVNRIILHPRYNRAVVDYDISIVELDTEINETSYVRPVCLPSRDQSAQPDTYCYITGWGHMGNRSKFLRTAKFLYENFKLTHLESTDSTWIEKVSCTVKKSKHSESEHIDKCNMVGLLNNLKQFVVDQGSGLHESQTAELPG